MKEFKLPDDWVPPEPPQPPSPLGFTTLLGSPSSRWIKGPNFGPFTLPNEADESQAKAALSSTDDPNFARASGGDLAAGDSNAQIAQPQAPQTPLRPSWEQAAKAIEAILAQMGGVFGTEPQPGAPPLRGVAPNVEPPSGSPEFQEAQARQTEVSQGGEPGAVPTPTATTLTVGAGRLAGTAAQELATMAARVAPTLARAAPALAAGVAAAPAVAAAVPFLLIPTNTQRGTLDLGDGLRVRWFPDQRTATVERRVDNGLLGSGLGARWEPLPIDATFGAGPDGRQSVLVDTGQLKRVIGPEATQRALRTAGIAPTPEPSGVVVPIIMEIRIGSSTNAGVTTTLREATREEILEVCPNFAEYEKIALKAAENARAAGLPNGLIYGNRVHNDVGAELQKMSEVAKMLEERGVHMLLPEIALLKGEKQSYYPKGSSVLDVLELHKQKTVCVYDFKTGNARFPDETITRYAREAARHAAAAAKGYTHIYVVPIRVP